jgi:hypothetical protein
MGISLFRLFFLKENLNFYSRTTRNRNWLVHITNLFNLYILLLFVKIGSLSCFNPLLLLLSCSWVFRILNVIGCEAFRNNVISAYSNYWLLLRIHCWNLSVLYHWLINHNYWLSDLVSCTTSLKTLLSLDLLDLVGL